MRQVHEHIEKIVFAQFCMNDEPVDMVEGLKRGNVIWLRGGAIFGAVIPSHVCAVSSYEMGSRLL